MKKKSSEKKKENNANVAFVSVVSAKRFISRV